MVILLILSVQYPTHVLPNKLVTILSLKTITVDFWILARELRKGNFTAGFRHMVRAFQGAPAW